MTFGLFVFSTLIITFLFFFAWDVIAFKFGKHIKSRLLILVEWAEAEWLIHSHSVNKVIDTQRRKRMPVKTETPNVLYTPLKDKNRSITIWDIEYKELTKDNTKGYVTKEISNDSDK